MRFYISRGKNAHMLTLSAPVDKPKVTERDVDIFINTDNPPSDDFLNTALAEFIKRMNSETGEE